MPLIFNGTEIDDLIFNGTEQDELLYNGVTVWEKLSIKTGELLKGSSSGSDTPFTWTSTTLSTPIKIRTLHVWGESGNADNFERIGKVTGYIRNSSTKEWKSLGYIEIRLFANGGGGGSGDLTNNDDELYDCIRVSINEVVAQKKSVGGHIAKWVQSVSGSWKLTQAVTAKNTFNLDRDNQTYTYTFSEPIIPKRIQGSGRLSQMDWATGHGENQAFVRIEIKYAYSGWQTVYFAQKYIEKDGTWDWSADTICSRNEEALAYRITKDSRDSSGGHNHTIYISEYYAKDVKEIISLTDTNGNYLYDNDDRKIIIRE